MKTTTKIILSLFILSVSTAGFSQDNDIKKANKKVDKAQEKVDKAKIDADNAKENADEVYKREWKEFKSETESQIDNNNKRIKELRRHKTSEPSKQDAFNKKIDRLEAENDRLKKDLKDYDYNGKDDWKEFKKSFNSRLDKLGDQIDIATE